MSETDSSAPYEDDYNFGNQFDRILWRPGHPLFQKELNEHQSSEINNLRLMFDDGIHMPNGTILSGMGVSMMGRKSANTLPDGTHPNLFTFSGHTGTIPNSNTPHGGFNTMDTGTITDDVDTYDKTGELDYQSQATDDNDNLGLDIFYPQPSDNQKTVTLSFDIERTDGILNNISINPVGGSVVDNATLDDLPFAGDITNNSGESAKVVQNGSASVFPLSDGNAHHVVITFNNSNIDNSNDVEFQLLFNRGFSALAGCDVKLVNFKIEEGSNVTAWQASEANNYDPDGGNRQNMVDVSGGSLYLDGQPRQFDEQQIGITGQGAEQVGVRLYHNVVSPNQDQALVDHTPGSKTEDAAGADREHYDVKLTYGSERSDAILFHFQDGQYVSNINSNQYDKLNTILATRTYEQSGSFLSWGMGLMPHADPFNANNIRLQVQSGAAYVLGNRITSNGTTYLNIPTETHAGHIPDELSAPFSTDSSNENYKLIYPSIQPVYTKQSDKNNDNAHKEDLDPGINVWGYVANVQVTLDGVEHGANPIDTNTSDNGESLGPDAQIVDPYDPNDPASNGKPYIVFNDLPDNNGKTHRYFANSGSYHFAPDPEAGGKEALYVDDDSKFITSLHQDINNPWGFTVIIRADVKRLFVDADKSNMSSDIVDRYITQTQGYSANGSNYDYHLVFVNQDGSVHSQQDYNNPTQKVAIDFNNDGINQPKGTKPSGVKPVTNSELTLDYDAYYSRDDLIILNANGTFHDVQGQPDFKDSVEPPTNMSENGNQTLTIGWVQLTPNSQLADTHESSIPAMPFSGIDDMALKIDNLQDNQAILAARISASSQINPMHLEDTFSDLFVTHDEADLSQLPQFDIRYSPHQFIEPGYAAEGDLPLAVQFNEIPSDARMVRNTTTGSTSYLNQDYYNTTLQLNRGTVQLSMGHIVCDPNTFHDHYADRTIWNKPRLQTLNQLKAQNAVNHAKGVPEANLYTKGGDYDIGGLDLSRNQINDIKQGNYKTDTYKRLEHTTTTFKYINQAYMCPQWIHISGSGFTPYADNLRVTIPTEDNMSCVTTADGSQHNLEALNISSNNELYGSDNFNNYVSNPALYNGSSNGTVKADVNGNVSCWFQLPETVHCGYQRIRLSNNNGDWAETVIDGTADIPTYHNTLNDLYINSGTLSDHIQDWVKRFMHQTDIRFGEVNDHFHEVDKFNDSASAAISGLQSNLSSDTASLNTHISSVTSSLSTAETDESQLVDSMYDAQQQVNSYVQNQLDVANSNILNLYDSTAANQADIIDNANSIASLASSTTNGFNSVNAGIDSLTDRAMSDEYTIYSEVGQEGYDVSSLSGGIDAALLAVGEAQAAASQANASAIAAQNYANTVSESASTAAMNNAQAAQAAQNTANSGSNVAHYDQVATYGNDNHDLADHEANNPSTRVSPWITNTMFSWGALGSLGTETAYSDGNSDWPGATNAAYNKATSQGGIWLVASPGDPGTSGSPVEVVPPDTNASEFNGRNMSYDKVKKNIIRYVRSQVTY